MVQTNPSSITTTTGATTMATYVGPLFISDGPSAAAQVRQGRNSEQIVSDAHGRYHEACSRGFVFSATNAATNQALTTLLATTYVGLCISNPANTSVSAKALSILNFSVISDGTASGAVGGIAIGGGGSSAGVTTHTTPLAALWGTNLLGPLPVGAASAGSAPGSVALVDSAATLVGSPRCIMNVMGGLLTTVPNTINNPVDVAGQIVVAPGGYVCGIALIAAMTHLLYSFVWEESAV